MLYVYLGLGDPKAEDFEETKGPSQHPTELQNWWQTPTLETDLPPGGRLGIASC